MSPSNVFVCDLKSASAANSQQISASTTSSQSAAVAQNISGLVSVRLIATSPVFIRSGDNPTAVSTGADVYVPANTPVRFQMLGAQRVAAITPSGTATVYITPDL